MLRRLFVLCAAPALLGLMLVAPPAYADKQTELNAKVKESIVYLQGTATGYVEIPPEHADGEETLDRRVGPITAEWSCSGFVVDPSGFIATAGHCVDANDRTTKNYIRKKFLTTWDQEGKLNTRNCNLECWVKHANEEQWLVEGADTGSQIPVKIDVMQANGPGRVISELSTVEVKDFQKFESGDNALVKVSGMPPLKPLVIAHQAPQPGEALTAVGFPASVWEVLDPNRLPQPSFKSGTASSQQVSPSGVSTIEINADVSQGMSGGPTVDNDTGEVLGTNSYLISGETQAFNFITDAGALRSFLQKNGVHLAELPTPKKPFPWMWVVVGVVSAVVVAALVALLAVLVRRKGRRQAPLPVGVSAPQGPGQTGPISSPTEGTPKDTGAVQPASAAPSEESTATEPHFCSSCGAEHHPAENFCPKCGKPISFGAPA